MSPSLSPFDPAHLLEADAVVSGYHCIDPRICADRMDLFVSEFGVPAGDAARPAPFAHHIRDVVGLCSEEQMLDVNACGRIALVANAHASRDGTARSNPRQAAGHMECAVPSHHSAPIRHRLANPQRAASLIGGGGVLGQSLRERPSTRANKSLTSGFRHGTRFLRCCVQGRVGASTPRGPHILAVAA